MQVRHNTALLEQAVDLIVKRSAIPTLEAEAAAQEKVQRATAFRRLATGGAIAIAAIGLGIGAALFFNEPTQPPTRNEQPKNADRLPEESVSRSDKTDKPEPSPAPSEEAPAPLDPPSTKPDIVTVDFNKFATRNVDFMGTSWEVVAGHYFADESDVTWQRAWCYTRRVVNGVDINISLVNRDSPKSPPSGPVTTTATLALAGLNDASAYDLATRCPWLDGKTFTTDQFATGPERTAPVTPPLGTPESPMELIVVDGWDAIGHDLPEMPLRNLAFEQCKQTCEANTACLAATFNKKYGVCFLKSDASLLVAERDAIVVAKDVVVGNLRKSNLAFKPKTELVGRIYSTLTVRYPDCIVACANDSSCQGFNYKRDASTCSMLNSVVRSNANPQMTSGAKAATY